MRMHADQLHIDATVVRRLVDDQYPKWRGEAIEGVKSDGTVNAIFRIGDELSARFPLQGVDPHAVRSELLAEADASRELASSTSFPCPLPVALGEPGENYPLPWAVQSWVPGRVATPTAVATSTAFAEDLVRLIGELRAVDTRGRGFSGAGRGGVLSDHDDWMATCFRESEHLLDVTALRRIWADVRELPAAETNVMSHRDLIPANLLIEGDRLAGVLDCGGFGPADPALDLVAAWHLLDQGARDVMRRSLDCSPVEWARGKGWAFQQVMGLVWYYRKTNPGVSAFGRSTLDRILNDRAV